MKAKIFYLIIMVFVMSSFVSSPKVRFSKKLANYVKTLPDEFGQITLERKSTLTELGNYIITERLAGKSCNLLFICTSNSRRSHMGQVWAYTAGLYYGIDSIYTFSGGTEATKVNINAISALRRSGFSANTSGVGVNPGWTIGIGENAGQFMIFSKKYDSSQNPKTKFAAIMVCSEADKSCPVVDGADIRLPMPYDDPKYYDNTPSQDQKYDERCRQIAREMFFLMDYVKSKLILKRESNK